MVAAEPATCPAPRKTLDSSRSCSRSVTRMKSHGCQFCEDGDRRPASSIWSRSAAGTGRSAKDRTLRRDVMSSHVCMTVPTPLVPRSFSARERLCGLAGDGSLGEVPYRPQELLGGLKLREVAGFWQQLEPGAGDRSGIGTAVAGI